MNIKDKLSTIFMAFSTGKSTEESSIKRYTGIGSVSVIAVNPNRDTFNKIFPNSKNTTPITYVGERQIEDKTVKTARVTFIVKLDPKFNGGLNLTLPITFNLEKRYRISGDGSKIQVIDEYGRTCWVTKQELETHAIPVYSNGPARISTNYKPVLRGEEGLTKFLRAFLSIDDIDVYNNDTKTWETNKDPESCKGYLENINKYFDGDFSEIMDTINLRPDNKVKVLFGVRHSEDNKDYQDFFNGFFLRNRQTSTSRLQREVENSKNAGGYANTDFEFDMIKEYEGAKPTIFGAAAPTQFKDPFLNSSVNKDSEVDDLPFGL